MRHLSRTTILACGLSALIGGCVATVGTLAATGTIRMSDDGTPQTMTLDVFVKGRRLASEDVDTIAAAIRSSGVVVAEDGISTWTSPYLGRNYSGEQVGPNAGYRVSVVGDAAQKADFARQVVKIAEYRKFYDLKFE